VSTPPGSGEPYGEPPLEPVRVIRPRRTDALAELVREFKEAQESQRDTGGHQDTAPPAPAASPTGPVEDATEELPPVPSTPPPGPAPRRAPDQVLAGTGRGLRRAAVGVAVAAAALTGFGCALLLPARGEAGAAPAARPSGSASAAAPAPAAAPTATVTTTVSIDPDGPGTLREGDTGPDVTELQQRLLRVPDVYRDGSTSGHYDSTLKAAVARFQLWYGISGDETGVYGDDTRRALESRTALEGG
jgi:hypothetical protein